MTQVVPGRHHHGRSLPDPIVTVNELAKRGIAFESVKEPIDTTTPAGKLVFKISASLAEFERRVAAIAMPPSTRAVSSNGKLAASAQATLHTA